MRCCDRAGHEWCSIGAVEAGRSAHGVHHGACCSEPPAPTSSPTTRIAVLVDFMGKVIALSRSVVLNCTWRVRLSHAVMVSCADVPASALDGGSWALGASHASMCSWPAVLPGCVLCSCLRCSCLCAHLWGGKRSFAREEPICVCPMQTLHRGLSGHKKRHCSDAFWSHDIIYG
jgi:hypothetical protein